MAESGTDGEEPVPINIPNKLKPGRPPVYVFDKPDDQLSKNERRLKHAVMKRRLRQNRSYHRKKRLRQALTFMQQPGPRTSSEPSDVVSASQRFPSNPIGIKQSKTSCPKELPSLPLPTSASGPATAQNFVLGDLSSRPDRLTETQNASGNFRSVTVTSPPALDTSSTLISSRNALAAFASVHTDVADPLSPGYPPTSGAPGSPSQHSTSLSPPCFMNDEDRLVHDILDLAVPPLTPDPRSAFACTASLASSIPIASALQADFSTRVSSLSSSSTGTMPALALFPASFSASSAAAVVNGLPQADPSANTVRVFTSDVLTPLVRTGLLEQSGQGRYMVSAMARRLLPSSESSTFSPRAMKNFISHFCSSLQALDPGTLSTGGSARLAAMLFYAEESQNVVAAIRFASQISPSGPFDVLCHAATVMRYCTAAEERVSVCSQALKSVDGGCIQAACQSKTSNRDIGKIESEARVRLALGEAYLDMLAVDTASEHIAQAVSLLAKVSRKPDVCVSSILALVLRAELRISQRAFADGSRLLAEALNALNSAGLQKSTFAACCLLSLGTVFSNMGQTEKALQAVSTALDVLSGLGYERMPIFADGLRTLGSVHLAAGDADRAQKLFIPALELIGKWIGQGAPMQHCMHLDIFLMELLAQTYEAQGRRDIAGFLIQKSGQQRKERKLEESGRGPGAALRTNPARWVLTRHLY